MDLGDLDCLGELVELVVMDAGDRCVVDGWLLEDEERKRSRRRSGIREVLVVPAALRLLRIKHNKKLRPQARRISKQRACD